MPSKNPGPVASNVSISVGAYASDILGFSEDGEVLASSDCDAEGTDLVGSDEYGTWWGTHRAPFVLGEGPVWCVSGYQGADHWHGRIQGTEAATRDYVARTHNVTDIVTMEE